MNICELNAPSAFDDGLGEMLPLGCSETDRLALLGACPGDDLLTVGFTTVSLI